MLGPLIFRTELQCSGGYHLERGEMPLHDAVEINCEKSEASEIQGAGIKYSIWPKGCMMDNYCECG